MEKQKAALASVIGGGLLTGLKLIVGLITGSLGILSEALHSGLDLAAALMAFFAVRIADKPPDDSHHYGHYKAESLSALAETFLLLLTSAWIIQEAIARLMGKEADFRVTSYSLGVMVLSVVMASSLSLILNRTANKYQSQALKADALHYTSDIFSSMVVLLGLIMARFGMKWADPVAALVVAALVIVAGIRLSREAINTLMDYTPEGFVEKVAQKALSVPGVLAVNRVRARGAGNRIFMDIEIGVKRSSSLEESHAIAREVEKAIHSLFPEGDVVIHTEPVAREESLYEKVQALASRAGLRAHSLSFHRHGNYKLLEMHLEVPADWPLNLAHEKISGLEEKLALELEPGTDIVTHIEPYMEDESPSQPVAPPGQKLLEKMVKEIGGQGVHSVQIHRHGESYHISLHLTVDPSKSVEEAHRIAEELERKMRQQLPSASRIVIHTEPDLRRKG